MKGVFAFVVIVEHNLDDLVLLEDEGVGVRPIDSGVRCSGAGGKSCVEGRDLGRNIAQVVEECVVGAITEVVHFDGEGKGIVGLGEERLGVFGDEGEVIKFIVGIEEGGNGQIGGVVVVDEVACDVGIECWRDLVEEVLCQSAMGLEEGSLGDYT